MSGVFGIVSSASQEEHQVVLERMARTIKRSSIQRADFTSSGQAGVGTVVLDQGYSGLAQHDGTWLAFSGTLVDAARLARDHGVMAEQEEESPGNQNLAPAGLLLRLFLRGGIEPLTGLNGGYTLAVWDGHNRRLYLMNDRVGYRPLYIWQTHNRILFSGEYKAISSLPSFPRKIDPVAVADLFHYRTVVAGRTLFSEIRALPPAALAVYEEGRLRVNTYWSPRYFPAGQPVRPDAAYADELADLLLRAVQRRVEDNTCLLITGGLDSRTVAGFYRQAAPQAALQTVTIGAATGLDAVIGQEVAQSLDLSFTRIPLDESYLEQYAARVTWQAETRIEAYASWILALAPYLVTNCFTYSLTGLYGNLVSGRNIPRALLQAKTLEDGLRIVGQLVQGEHSGLERVMRPDVLKEASQESFQFYPDVYRASNAPDLLYRYDSISLAHRVSRHGNTADALGDVSIPLEPYLDNDVLDFTFEGIPSRVRTQAVFYSNMIVRRLEKVSRVREGRSGYSVRTGLWVSQNPYIEMLDDYRLRAAKRLFPGRHGEAVSCIPLAGAIRGGSRAYIEGILNRSDLLDDWFDMKAVCSLLEDHVQGRVNAFKTISSLVTFALWRLQFIELCQAVPESREAHYPGGRQAVYI